MEKFVGLIQIAIAISVAYVWIFRYHNVVREFQEFGLSDLTRNAVGAAKIAVATVLAVGLWYPELVLFSAALMGLFMVAAQYFHFKRKNPFVKHLPSLILLVLCAFIVVTTIY